MHVMLTNQQLKQLHKGVLRTFDRRELERLLSAELGRQTNNTYANSDYHDFAFDLINDAEMQGWMDELLTALYNERPQESVFRELAGRSDDPILPKQRKKPKQSAQMSTSRREMSRTLAPVIGLLCFAVFLFFTFFTARVQTNDPHFASPTPTATSTPTPTISYATSETGSVTREATPLPPSLMNAVITWQTAKIDKDFKELELGGEAPYDAPIRILLDNQEIENVERVNDNRWVVTTDVPASGTHTIVVELLDEDENSVKRFQRELEVPFRP